MLSPRRPFTQCTMPSGTVSATLPTPLRTPATVEDLLNAINNSEADVRASINTDGTGIDIVNPNQGTAMPIGENGGTPAADLPDQIAPEVMDERLQRLQAALDDDDKPESDDSELASA